MTIAQAECFYEQDKKDYILEKNEAFLNWLETAKAKGYSCFIDTNELQQLLDSIVTWYEIKYPEREFAFFEGMEDMRFKGIQRISTQMDMQQLFFRLSDNQLCLMECGYRARLWNQQSIYENDKEVGSSMQILLQINRKKQEQGNSLQSRMPSFFLCADYRTGRVMECQELEAYLTKKNDMHVEEALAILNEKYASELDFSEVEECVYNHSCDMELRRRILQLATLKLVYSKNTIPERGYVRAEGFVNEFNKKLNLNLTMEDVEDALYWNDNKEEAMQLKKSRGLIKSFSRKDNS